MEKFYLEIIINLKYQGYRYTIQVIEKFIEKQLRLREDQVRNLIETQEYKLVRTYIDEFLSQPNILTSLRINDQCLNCKILFSFNECKTDKFIIPAHQNIRLKFYDCEFNTLDFSGSELELLQSNLFSSNQIKKIILPKTLQQFYLSRSSISQLECITFTSYDIESIIIEDYIPENIFAKEQHINKKILDFSKFSKLKELHIKYISKDINKSVKLPNCLLSLKIYCGSELDLDLRECKNLQTLYFEKCQINKLITINHTIFEKCTVNYYYSTTQSLYSQLQQFNDIKIKTLQLQYTNSINEIYLNAINTIIITNNNFNQGTLDFTLFPSLLVINLSKITCDTIKFGSYHKKIIIKDSESKRINLKFSDKNHADCVFEQCRIDVMSINSKFKLDRSCIGLIHLQPPLSYCKLLYFTENYTGQCKQFVKCNKNSKQRFLYQLHQLKDNNYKKNACQTILTISSARILVSKIEFIYAKISELMYE